MILYLGKLSSAVTCIIERIWLFSGLERCPADVMFNPNAASFGPTLPTLATAQHSQVRQEADYIRDRLTAEQIFSRRLLNEIKKGEKRLGKAREDESLKEAAVSLKKGIKKQRSRLNRSTRNQQLLEERLAALLAEIERLEQRQWRRSAPPLYTRQTLSSGQMADPPYGPLWSTHPAPLTAALWPPPMLPFHLQATSPAVFGYAPRAPTLQPVRVPGLSYYQPIQQSINGFDDTTMSPADTVSPYDLNPARGFPVAQSMGLIHAMDGMQICEGETSSIQSYGTEEAFYSSMPDHQSAAIRLKRTARNRIINNGNT